MEGDEYDWKFQVVCAHKHAGKWCVRERLFAIGRRKETEQTGGSGSSSGAVATPALCWSNTGSGMVLLQRNSGHVSGSVATA